VLLGLVFKPALVLVELLVELKPVVLPTVELL
jgi:hypothetical protein